MKRFLTLMGGVLPSVDGLMPSFDTDTDSVMIGDQPLAVPGLRFEDKGFYTFQKGIILFSPIFGRKQPFLLVEDNEFHKKEGGPHIPCTLDEPKPGEFFLTRKVKTSESNTITTVWKITPTGLEKVFDVTFDQGKWGDVKISSPGTGYSLITKYGMKLLVLKVGSKDVELGIFLPNSNFVFFETLVNISETSNLFEIVYKGRKSLMVVHKSKVVTNEIPENCSPVLEEIKVIARNSGGNFFFSQNWFINFDDNCGSGAGLVLNDNTESLMKGSWYYAMDKEEKVCVFYVE